MLLDFYRVVLMAITIYREASNQSYEGKLAIGHVILNRANDLQHRWPNDVISVILQPLQFTSITYKADGQLTRFMSPVVAAEYLKLSASILLGLTQDPTGGANHYYNPKAVDKEPSWAKPEYLTKVIQDHKFYKL